MPTKKSKFKPYRHTTNYYRKIKKNCELSNEICSSRQKVSSNNLNVDEPENQHSFLECEGPLLQSEGPILQSDGPLFQSADICDNNVDTNHGIDPHHLENISSEHVNDFQPLDEIHTKLGFSTKLQNWALKNHIKLSAMSELLQILKSEGHDKLPKDARSLLGTPRDTNIKEMGTGKFWYNGLKNNILSAFCSLQNPITIKLIINIDGMSPFQGSNLQCWPILFKIDQINLKPMVIAIYNGEGKPPLDMFLREFIEEMNLLINDGLLINGNLISISIKCFVCDTQARSWIKGTPASNSEYGSCIKCTVVGEWDKKGHHMSYPRINCTLRTNESFRQKLDEDHHKIQTPLVELPIDMVQDFIVADSLHLFDLGIMRRCLFGWREGSYNFRSKMSKLQADKLSEALQNTNNLKPSDFHRSIRGLKLLHFWKGTEFRVFLLYTGIVVLKDFVSSEIYDHFVILSTAVTILSCQSYLKYINIASKLLESYIEKFIELYGIDAISSNVHNLCHVVEDVKKFGPLPVISAYDFESMLGEIKNLVRSGNLPLSQISKRIIELSKSPQNMPNNFKPSFEVHPSDPVKDGEDLPSKKFNRLHLKENFFLSNDEKNKYFMTYSREIISMINAITINNDLYIHGYPIQNKYNFFLSPFESSKLNIYASKGFTENNNGNSQYKLKYESPKYYLPKDIKCKLFCQQYHNEFVFIPLLHTIDVI